MDHLPTYYKKNSRHQINLVDGETVSVIVEKAITPLTTSQVLVVHVECPYDNITPYNVSYALRKHLLQISTSHPIPPYQQTLPFFSRYVTLALPPIGFVGSCSLAAAESLCIIPNQPHPTEDVLKHIFNERSLQMDSIDAWNTEFEAYQRLKRLQGFAIPQFYLSGTFLPPDTARAIDIGVILLEYVPNAISLANCAPELVTAERAHYFIRAMCEVHELGVIHNDVHANNYLTTPSRDCIVDFGLAAIREPDENDEHWSEAVDEIGDLNGFKFALKRKMK